MSATIDRYSSDTLNANGAIYRPLFLKEYGSVETFKKTFCCDKVIINPDSKDRKTIIGLADVNGENIKMHSAKRFSHLMLRENIGGDFKEYRMFNDGGINTKPILSIVAEAMASTKKLYLKIRMIHAYYYPASDVKCNFEILHTGTTIPTDVYESETLANTTESSIDVVCDIPDNYMAQVGDTVHIWSVLENGEGATKEKDMYECTITSVSVEFKYSAVHYADAYFDSSVSEYFVNSEIQVGARVYQNANLTTPAPDGFYVKNRDYYVVNNGVITKAGYITAYYAEPGTFSYKTNTNNVNKTDVTVKFNMIVTKRFQYTEKGLYLCFYSETPASNPNNVVLVKPIDAGTNADGNNVLQFTATWIGMSDPTVPPNQPAFSWASYGTDWSVYYLDEIDTVKQLELQYKSV